MFETSYALTQIMDILIADLEVDILVKSHLNIV